MLQAWWNATMDARRAISLPSGVAGLALIALSVAASSVPLALDGTLVMAVCSPALGAAAGGYVGHRSSDPRRARLWAVAYGARPRPTKIERSEHLRRLDVYGRQGGGGGGPEDGGAAARPSGRPRSRALRTAS